MIRHIQTLIHRWSRLRRARLIHAELAEAGYSADDLRRLAHLRAAVEPMSDDVPSDPKRPALDDVLDLWQRPAPRPDSRAIVDGEALVLVDKWCRGW
jgi:hypothetical protein